jgi:hypothetical protein
MKFTIIKSSQAIQGNTSEKPCEWAKWDAGKQRWVVEIQDLGDLLALQKDVEDEIILKNDTLEIYDVYRE